MGGHTGPPCPDRYDAPARGSGSETTGPGLGLDRLVWPSNNRTVPPYLPVFFDLHGRLCAVVGGGAVATRKARAVVGAGGQVRVVAPAFTAELGALPRERVELIHRPYETGDLDGACLAFAATDDPRVNQQVLRDARAAGIPVASADAPRSGDFILPAVHRHGEITIGISTGGASPIAAQLVREEVARSLDGRVDDWLETLAALRAALRLEVPDPAARRQAWRRAVAAGLLDHLRAGDLAAAQRSIELARQATSGS